MKAPVTSTSLFAACVSLVLLAGCGGPPPKGEKKADPSPSPNLNVPNPNPNPAPPKGDSNTPSEPPKNTLGDVEKAADDAATAFLRDLVQGTAKADALSAKFVQIVGKPVVLPSDKAKGYSTDAATDWLKKVGDGVNIGLPTKRQQAGDVVYIRGIMSGRRLGNEPNKTGGYSLRLVKEGGAWKVDWLSLSSAEVTATTTTPTPESAAQEFAVVAFVETVADLNGMPKDERLPLIAAALTPDLRKAWAPPFDQDTNQGYDYSPAKIGTEATKIGGGTSSFTATRVGDLPEFTVVLTKPAGKKTYTVRLARGANANEWLVNEVVEAKG